VHGNRVTPGDSKKLYLSDHPSSGFEGGLLWKKIRDVVIAEKKSFK
jgi:hypothetical protein